ncbi:MAG: hypothetical protein P4N60_00340 [Verrucomicrobiae bacterium]|nr:hypothetical protein [Verrucomicrobiae bacterium]
MLKSPYVVSYKSGGGQPATTARSAQILFLHWRFILHNFRMTSANPQLLRSLGRLARGLSALFWGLPAWLIVSVETAKVELLRPLGLAPALALNLLLIFGLWRMGSFQKQERPWRQALDRARLLGLVNLGLCPFLFWFSRMPEQSYFQAAIGVLVLSALVFLFNLNVVLKQLGAMLPDETLRQETRQFTEINRWLIVAWLLVVAFAFAAQHVNSPLYVGAKVLFWLQHMETAILLFLGLAPLAITMALIWKAKEVILDSVFGERN